MTKRAKLTASTVLLGLAMGLAGTGALMAQEPAATGFEAFDTDGDGVISRDEWVAGLAQLPPGMARALDPEGWRLAMARQLIAEFDRDGDGQLDAEELAAAMAAGPGLRWAADGARARDGAGWAPGARRGDMRSDGRRDWEQRAARRDAMGALRFDQIDADGDGVITREEWEAARGQGFDNRRGRAGDGRGWDGRGERPRDGSGWDWRGERPRDGSGWEGRGERPRDGSGRVGDSAGRD